MVVVYCGVMHYDGRLRLCFAGQNLDIVPLLYPSMLPGALTPADEG
jgi:hypothetical protein